MGRYQMMTSRPWLSTCRACVSRSSQRYQRSLLPLFQLVKMATAWPVFPHTVTHVVSCCVRNACSCGWSGWFAAMGRTDRVFDCGGRRDDIFYRAWCERGGVTQGNSPLRSDNTFYQTCYTLTYFGGLGTKQLEGSLSLPAPSTAVSSASPFPLIWTRTAPA